jgi:sulfur carrier protein
MGDFKTMKITINGEETQVKDNTTISELLVEREVRMPDMVSVELNGDILSKAAFETTTLKENDAVEFLYFMGGGTTRG